MKLNKIAAFGIMILMIMGIAATAISAVDLNPLHALGIGGKQNKASSNLAKKLLDTMTSKESTEYMKQREEYWISQGETATEAKKKAAEDLLKYKTEKAAKEIASKISGFIGGAMTGVFTTVGTTMEGVVRSTPAKQTYDTIMDKVKYSTNIEYKVASVKAKNEIYWNRACDELEKLQPGYKCERPKAALVAAGVRKVVTSQKPAVDPELQAILNQMK